MRLFVGVPVPSDAFQAATDDLARLEGIRPVPPGSWHVTIRFLGEADPDAVAAAIGPAVAGLGPVHATVRGVGAFSDPRRARVAWAAVHADRLGEVEGRVRGATGHLGRPPDSRAFVPHVTLARLSRPMDVRTWVRRHEGDVFFEGRLPELVLYASELSEHGPVYTRAAVWPLGEAGDADANGEAGDDGPDGAPGPQA